MFRAFAQTLFTLVLLATASAPMAQDGPVHDEIRAMRDGAIAAFLERDKAAFLSHFHETVLFTAMDNEVVRGVAAADAYYDRMLVGSESLVENLEVDFAVDELTTLYLNDTQGIAAGDMTAGFQMRAGLEFSVPLRWTAAMVKEGDVWKVTALHFSANMFDNPLDNALRDYVWWIVAAVAVLGLLIGLIVGRVSKR